MSVLDPFAVNRPTISRAPTRAGLAGAVTPIEELRRRRSKGHACPESIADARQCEHYEAVLERCRLRMAPTPDVAHCCHCDRFRFGQKWRESAHVDSLELVSDSGAQHCRMIHTLCPSCRASLRAFPQLVRFAI